MEGCLQLVEAQMLDLSDRPYAATERASRTVDLFSILADLVMSSTQTGRAFKTRTTLPVQYT